MSGVVIVNVLWRMAVSISNTVISLELKRDWLIDNGLVTLRLLIDH